MTDSDEGLYHRVKQGDMRAFDELYARYETRLFGFLRSQLPTRADAEDVFHETFLRALKSVEVTFDRGGFPTWLYRVARNISLNRIRSAQRGARAVAVLHPPTAGDAGQHAPRADDSLAAHELEDALDKAVSRLPPSLSELPPGTPVVKVVRRDGKVETFTAKGPPVLAAVPLVVLVDHDTSSGAEFLTAALQEGRHARVVGARTFGKWSVQRLEDLPNGYAYKFTSSLFTSPSGRAFPGAGLTPDVEVDAPQERVEKFLTETDTAKRVEGDVQLRTAVALLVK